MAPIDTFKKAGDDGEFVPGIQDYAMIGSLRTAAMISLTGSIDSFCMPYFDSPSIFARIVDKDKGGHFQIKPTSQFTTKQAYLPSSNVLATKFLSEEGVGSVTDLLVPKSSTKPGKTYLPWLVRRVEVIRGKLNFRVECMPGFNYCRDKHTTEFVRDDSQVASKEFGKQKVLFTSPDISIDVRVVTSGEDLYAVAGEDEIRSEGCEKKMAGDNEVTTGSGPIVDWQELDLTGQGHLSTGAYAEFELREGEVVDFILRQVPKDGFKRSAANRATEATKEMAEQLGVDLSTLARGVSKIRSDEDPILSSKLVQSLIEQTNSYWIKWISACSYKGRWREAVQRQALTLKMLVYEETGAIIAAPTFSLPEHIGGTRNWDYRFTWIRDSSFTLYALIRLGYTAEANAFMDFIQQRLFERNSDGSLQISVYTIHGGKEAPEEELTHLAGHKDSKPVRIGNGAVDHLQLDIYGELMDSIYLAQKFSKPLSWSMWVATREMVDYVCANWNQPDLSIWEVRNQQKNFLYSKIMLWVAVDRGLRLADKRSLPLKQRDKWLATRDEIYEEVMTKGWNEEEKFFAQAYESLDVLDSAVLIMPLTFFMSAADPRFRSTLDRILRTPEKGGLTTNNLVFRYDTSKVEDGVGGAEGAFTLCTLWAVEAVARAGAYDPSLLPKATAMFEDLLGYGNHVGLFSEEISRGGEGLGNTPQGFSAVTLISTAYNLDRTLSGGHF